MTMVPHVCRCGTCFQEMPEVAKVSDEETEEHWCEDGLTGLALELADMVSDMIWGGERGWERATKEQFQHLKAEARKRMKTYVETDPGG